MTITQEQDARFASILDELWDRHPESRDLVDEASDIVGAGKRAVVERLEAEVDDLGRTIAEITHRIDADDAIAGGFKEAS